MARGTSIVRRHRKDTLHAPRGLSLTGINRAVAFRRAASEPGGARLGGIAPGPCGDIVTGR